MTRLRPFALAGRLTLLLAVALGASVEVAHAQGDAQAWVPGKGHGTFALAVGTQTSEGQLLDDGTNVSVGEVTSKALYLAIDYGLTDRLAVTLAIPFIEKKYEGPAPHRPTFLLDPRYHDMPFLDDGDYHGSWQDFSLRLRYNLKPEPFLITPYVALNTPSNDYAFFAHSAVGTQQTRLQFGIDFGKVFEAPLQNLYLQGGYSYTFVEEEFDVNVDFSTVKLEVGYLLSPQWTVKLVATGQKSHGGLEFPSEFSSFRDEKWLHHDQIQRSDYVLVGVGLSYQVNDDWGLFGYYGETVWGENSINIDQAVTVGLTRSF